MVLKCVLSHFKPFKHMLFFNHTPPSTLILPEYIEICLSVLVFLKNPHFFFFEGFPKITSDNEFST